MDEVKERFETLRTLFAVLDSFAGVGKAKEGWPGNKIGRIPVEGVYEMEFDEEDEEVPPIYQLITRHAPVLLVSEELFNLLSLPLDRVLINRMGFPRIEWELIPPPDGFDAGISARIWLVVIDPPDRSLSAAGRLRTILGKRDIKSWNPTTTVAQLQGVVIGELDGRGFQTSVEVRSIQPSDNTFNAELRISKMEENEKGDWIDKDLFVIWVPIEVDLSSSGSSAAPSSSINQRFVPKAACRTSGRS